jgi:pyruvate dehydrogenase E2 component (dihydrolipoamide acetyltransferase)
MELVARAGGTLLKQVVAAGSTVPVSELVAVIGEPGEKVEAPAAGRGDGQAAAAKKPAPKAEAPETHAPAAVEANGQPAVKPTTPGPVAPPAARSAGRVKASPLARRMAAERGIDISGVAGSGPEGRIVARDVEGSRLAARMAAAAGRAPAIRVPAGQPYQDVPLSQIRKTIAKRLVQSIGPIPTFYLTTEVDMERSREAREALLEAGGEKVSFNDIVIKAVAMALRQHPECNAWWQDDHIRYWNEVHVSMAVAIEEGLITPVIRHTDLKSLREIAAESRDLAGRARERRLMPEEYTGGTFSVSNLGMLDIDEFTAVINPPEAGILAVGRMVERPVVHEGAVAIRRRMRLTMSCDHRVIDGATGARFLQTLTRMLENPLAMVY